MTNKGLKMAGSEKASGCLQELESDNLLPVTQATECIYEMSDQILTQEHLFILQSELGTVYHKWYDIGLQLKVQPGILDRIKSDHPNDAKTCFREAFAFILKRFEPQLTWEALATALETPNAVDAGQVARNIRQKYCKHEVVTTASDQPSKRSSFPITSKPSSWDPIPHFPDTSHLDLDSEIVENLKAVLQVQSEDLEKAFYDLFLSTKKSLIEREIDPRHLVVFYGSLKPQFKDNPLSNKPLKECRKDLECTESLEELFDLLGAFVSPFNYDLVKSIIEALGTPADKDLLEKYEEYFVQFCERRVSEALPCYCRKLEGDTTIWVKIDEIFDTLTVRAMRQFRYKLMSILKVECRDLRLVEAHEGCVELTFALPSHIATSVFPLSHEQEEDLHKAKFKALACDLYSFPKEEVSDPLNVALCDVDKHISKKQLEKIKFFTASIIGLQKMESVTSVLELYLVLFKHMYDRISAVSILHCLLMKVGVDPEHIASLIPFSYEAFMKFSSLRFCEFVVSIAIYLGSETPSRRLMSIAQREIASTSKNIQTAIMRIFFQSQALRSSSNFPESIHKVALWLNEIGLWDLAVKLVHEAECLIDRDVHICLLYSGDVDTERTILQELQENDDLRHLNISFSAPSKEELDISKIVQRGGSGKLASLEIYCNPMYHETVGEVVKMEVARVLSLNKDDIKVCTFFEMITLSWEDLKRFIHKAFLADELNVDAIIELMNSYSTEETDWSAHVADHQGYARSVIEGNSQYEVTIQSLEEGCEVPIHDQGTAESHSFIKVLSGSVKVTIFEWPDAREPNTRMVVKDSKVYNKNSVVYMNDSMGLLHLENAQSDSKTVTLHVHSPPIDTCQQFEKETGRSSAFNFNYSGGIPCIYHGNAPQTNSSEWENTSKSYDVDSRTLADSEAMSELPLSSSVIQKVSKAVCKIQTSTGRTATGFLVHFHTAQGGDVKGLLTIHHAFESSDLSDERPFTVTFDDTVLQLCITNHFRFTCSLLDVTFILFDEDTIQKLQRCFLTISMQELDRTESIFVMQHPEGHKLHFGRGAFIEYHGLDMHYSLTTELDFSGSPVFLKDGSLIGIHKNPMARHSAAVTMQAITRALFPFFETPSLSAHLVSNPITLNREYETNLLDFGLERKAKTHDQIYVSPASVCGFFTYITPIWFAPTSHGWYWSPANPLHRSGGNWAPVSQLKVCGGFWNGQTPVQKNVAINDWLCRHNITCGVCPSV